MKWNIENIVMIAIKDLQTNLISALNKELVWLISFFNCISTFMGYLMPNSSL